MAFEKPGILRYLTKLELRNKSCLLSSHVWNERRFPQSNKTVEIIVEIHDKCTYLIQQTMINKTSKKGN